MTLATGSWWIRVFERPSFPDQYRSKRTLLDLYSYRVAIIGAVEFEVLSGIRNRQQADWMGSRFNDLHWPDLSRIDWRLGARLSVQLKAAGAIVPMTDLILASLAMRLGCSIYTTDPHFEMIRGLRLFAPE